MSLMHLKTSATARASLRRRTPLLPEAPLAYKTLEAGMTVIEMIFVTALLLVIVTVFSGILISMTNATNHDEAIINNEQAVRFVVDQMQREIRSANPLVAYSSVSPYNNQLEMMLGPTSGPQSIVQWFYDTNPSSPTYEQIVRQVLSTTGSNPAVLSGGWTLSNVRNVETNTPIFTYYDQHGKNMVTSSSYSASTIASCGVRVDINVSANPNLHPQKGPAPYTEQIDVAIRNFNSSGGVGCA